MLQSCHMLVWLCAHVRNSLYGKLIVVMVQLKARMSSVHPAVDWLYLCMAATAAVEKACLQSSSTLIWTTELHKQVCYGWPFAFTPCPSASCICLSVINEGCCLHVGLSAVKLRVYVVMTNQLSSRHYEIQYTMLLQSFFERTHSLAFVLQQTCPGAVNKPDGTPTLYQEETLNLTIHKPDALNHAADCVAFPRCTHGHYITEVWNVRLKTFEWCPSDPPCRLLLYNSGVPPCGLTHMAASHLRHIQTARALLWNLSPSPGCASHRQSAS